MINVTKTFLPDFEEYTAVLRRAWESNWITNNGALVQQLESDLKSYLKADHLLFTTNGTVVLQMALKAFNITKEVITTPFSYVATTNVILWENCTPVFVDIDSKTLCIDPAKIEAAITENTEAILATHVFGVPCDVEAIESIAAKHDLRIIYDGAHAFGAVYKGKQVLNYGDISTCSFHATKLFHTVEGGCIIVNNRDIQKKLMLYRQFGHINDDYYSVGINAKNSELHAAMGLCMLPKIGVIINRRKEISALYDKGLSSHFTVATFPEDLEYNYAYYPLLFSCEEQLLRAAENLKKRNIFGRRYFFPSLNELPYVERTSCPVSEDISRRILCLPLYFDLTFEEVSIIIDCLLE